MMIGKNIYMIIKNDIEHGFINKAHNLNALFSGNSLSSFMKELNKQSQIDIIRYPENDYKGDAFEFLIEIFLKVSFLDNRLGIKDYHPIKSLYDIGADGIGVNLSQEKCLIQIKYRQDVLSVLVHNDDNLGNLVTYGLFSTNPRILPIVDANKEMYRHYIFTTAKGLHHHTDNVMFKNTVKCYGYNELSKLMNNIHFWDLCREIIK